jgi:hypothetical protein
MDAEEPPKWMKYLPIIALVISICALTFQVTVLYPWHEELSRQFARVAKAVKR